ncbi:MAG: ABC transporter ATP-binding protein [Mycoplasmatales bacterium]
MLTRYKKSWKYIKKQKKYLIFMVIGLFVFQVTAMLSPLIIQKIIDNNLLVIDDVWYELKLPDTNINQQYLQTNNIVEYQQQYYVSSLKIDDSLTKYIKQKVNFELKNGTYYLVANSKKQKLTKQEFKLFYNSIIIDSIKLCILLLITLIINLVFSYFQRISGAYLTIKTTKQIREEAAYKLEYIDIAQVENDPAGKLANRFLNDSLGVSELYTSTINVFLSSILAIILSFIGMYILSPKMAIFALIIIPIMFFWIKFFIKRMKVIAEKINETNSLIIAYVNEIINGIFILKIFNSENLIMDKFTKLNEQYVDEAMSEINLHLSYGWNGVNLFQGIFIGGVILIFGVFDLLGFAVQAGIIYAYYNYLTKIISPINLLFHEFSRIEHANVKFERISKILDSEVEENEIKSIKEYAGDVVFKNVNFQYNATNLVLQNINLHIKAGEKIGIVGRSGAGKSTLINLLLRFNELQDNAHNQGTIQIDEQSIYVHNKRTYRQHIGIILQEPIIFQGTLYTNIKMKQDVSETFVQDTLIQIGGVNLLKKFNNNINQVIKNRGANLSLGEKQLISFARILVQNPKLLIMDEATANIDTETESIINQALAVISQNRTVIVVAHRLSTIKDSNQIIVMESGKITEKGTHKSLLQKSGKYYEMWMNQL